MSQGARIEAGFMLDKPGERVPERLRALAEFLLEKGWKEYKTIGVIRDAAHRGERKGTIKDA